MTAYMDKVKAVCPSAYCFYSIDRWWVCSKHGVGYGQGKTAFLAWVDAWRNIEKERGGK